MDIPHRKGVKQGSTQFQSVHVKGVYKSKADTYWYFTDLHMKIITRDSRTSDVVDSKQQTYKWYIKSKHLIVVDKMNHVHINYLIGQQWLS